MTKTMKLRIAVTILLVYLLIPYFSSGQVSGPGRVIQGTVTSATDGETLVGVNVIEVDNQKRIFSATTTDINGHYVIKVKNPSNRLVFSFIGQNYFVFFNGGMTSAESLLLMTIVTAAIAIILIFVYGSSLQRSPVKESVLVETG